MTKICSRVIIRVWRSSLEYRRIAVPTRGRYRFVDGVGGWRLELEMGDGRDHSRVPRAKGSKICGVDLRFLNKTRMSSGPVHARDKVI